MQVVRAMTPNDSCQGCCDLNRPIAAEKFALYIYGMEVIAATRLLVRTR